MFRTILATMMLGLVMVTGVTVVIMAINPTENPIVVGATVYLTAVAIVVLIAMIGITVTLAIDLAIHVVTAMLMARDARKAEAAFHEMIETNVIEMKRRGAETAKPKRSGADVTKSGMKK